MRHRGRPRLLDLDYSEDSSAEVDANVVMTGDDGLVEVQATAERTPLSRASLDELLALAASGIERLRAAQQEAVGATPFRAVRLIVATRNEHKLVELRRSMRAHQLEPLPDEIQLPPETGTAFAQNALGKARAAAGATGRRRSPTTRASRRPR